MSAKHSPHIPVAFPAPSAPSAQPSRRWRRGIAAAATTALALSGVLGAATLGALAGPATQAQAAAAVPNVKALAGDLSRQKIAWGECDFGSADLNDRFRAPNVSCATIKVPRDWHNPGNGKTWDIRISQAKNIDVKNARYKGTIFVNPGGPGGEGLVWGAAMQARTPDLNPYYNYIGFDPRGVGQSSHALCMYPLDTSSTDPNEEARAIGTTCSKNEDVKTINTEQTTYDMDFIRALLGAPKLSYIGYSYGTWLGAWYEKVFGAKYGDKFVLDSSTDVTDATLQRTWDLQPTARDRQFEMHLMNWIARKDHIYHLGTDPVKIYQDYQLGAKNRGELWSSFVWFFQGGAAAFSDNSKYPVAAAAVQFISSYAHDDAAQRKGIAPANAAASAASALTQMKTKAPATQQASLELGIKQLKALAKLSPTQAKTGVVAPRASSSTEEPPNPIVMAGTDDPFDMIRCNDGQWTQGAAYWNAWNKKMAAKNPLSRAWGVYNTAPACAFWRTQNMMPVATAAFPKTVVIQGEMDSQTAWETGYDSGTGLPNTSFIAIDNEGSHGHFPYGTEAVDRPVFDYFLSGKQPADIKVTQAHPLPNETATYESWKRLNKKAQHSGPLAVSPWIVVAGTPSPAAGAAKLAGDNRALSAASFRGELERFVRSNYGEAGVKALRAAGK